MKIVIDTREQMPFLFKGENFPNVEVTRSGLRLGDYSLLGLNDKVAVERKSVADLIQCLGRERERFEVELVNSKALDAFAVVVEGSFQDILDGKYRSRFNPKAAIMSILAFCSRHRIPFLFCGTRSAAELATYGFLRTYLRNVQCRWKLLAATQPDIG